MHVRGVDVRSTGRDLWCRARRMQRAPHLRTAMPTTVIRSDLTMPGRRGPGARWSAALCTVLLVVGLVPVVVPDRSSAEVGEASGCPLPGFAAGIAVDGAASPPYPQPVTLNV